MISTEVLDSTSGRPAAGIEVRLCRQDVHDWTEVATGTTGSDGRVADLGADLGTPRGLFRLTYGTGAYLAELGEAVFHPRITIEFLVVDPTDRHNIVLLFTSHSYTTYRATQPGSAER